MSVAAAAVAWRSAGFSTIPIAPNQTKRPGFWKKPATRWKDFQVEAASLEQVNQWWANGHELGLALIMGKVSGNAEMLELEARACDTDTLTLIANEMDVAGVGHIWDMLNGPQAYSELSPAGGLHFIYRLSTGTVPGNEKVARRPATPEELAENPEDVVKVLSETRGEGGYVIVAPTSGLCHPSGEAWTLINGSYGTVPTITWEERNLVITAIRTALDGYHTRPNDQSRSPELPAEQQLQWTGAGDQRAGAAASHVLPAVRDLAGDQPGGWTYTGTDLRSAPGGLAPYADASRPGDDFEARTDWSDHLLLGGAGWTLVQSIGNVRHWCRPGKDPREGISATTGRDVRRDRLYVFSTATAFPTEEPITKFAAFAILHHGGDHSGAASALRRLGYGSGLHRSQLRHSNGDINASVESDLGLDSGHTFRGPGSIDVESSDSYLMDDLGACERLLDRFNRDIVIASEERQFYQWEGGKWEAIDSAVVSTEYSRMTIDMAFGANEEEAKWARTKLRSGTRAAWVVRNLHFVEGVGVSSTQFNRTDIGALNLRNGVLNLHTGELYRHDKHMMLSRQFGASFNPQATCPMFLEFMEQVLPDPTVRAYVQRAVGYSLLGEASERALFLVWGPSGTGKSQFMETVQHVFGDYATTAGLGAFMGKHDSGPTEAHRLRGKRFVSTSETADDARFDEEMVKRLTGSDTMSTRTLYQQPIEWRPECAIWIATNHKPRFSSDDDAIWRRSKLIPFTTRFGSEDGPMEIIGYARRFLFAEADGILNWMLEGLTDYLANGLDEPGEIRLQVAGHRQEVDTVASFLEDSEQDGKLLRREGWILSSELYQVYGEWCRISGERPFGRRRFTNRVLANWPEIRAEKQAGRAVLRGIVRGALQLRGGLFTQSERDE